jgi:hypothetical protein
LPHDCAVTLIVLVLILQGGLGQVEAAIGPGNEVEAELEQAK